MVCIAKTVTLVEAKPVKTLAQLAAFAKPEPDIVFSVSIYTTSQMYLRLRKPVIHVGSKICEAVEYQEIILVFRWANSPSSIN